MQGITGFLLGISVGAAVGAIVLSGHSGHPEPANADDPHSAIPDKVQLASEESFPASDAPAY